MTRSDDMNVEFYVHSILIAHRQPGETDVPIQLTWILNDQDFWVRWVLPEPISSYWYKIAYEDIDWMITYIGTGPIPSTEQGEIYYRRHFDLPSNPPSRLGVVLQTSSPLIVYLNEVLVFKTGVSENCAGKGCGFTPISHWVHPRTYSFVTPIASTSEEGKAVFAVRLLGRQSVPQQISFQLIAFPIYSSVLLSSPACTPRRSPAVTPVSPVSLFVG